MLETPREAEPAPKARVSYAYEPPGLTNATIPVLMDFSEVICPAERRALREIVETAEVVREGDHIYLVARVSAATLDSLATFETAREDLEDGGDTEMVDEDGTDGSALEWQAEPGGFVPRSAYLVGRQEGHRATYDVTRDDEELRKVKRQVNALAAKKRKRAGLEDRKETRP